MLPELKRSPGCQRESLENVKDRLCWTEAVMRRPAVALVYMPREIGLKDFILVEEDVLVQEEQRNSSAAISKTLACILLQKTRRGGAWGKEKIHSILVQI